MSHDTMLRDDSFRFGTSEWCTERKCRTFSSLLQHLPEAPWWYDISTSTGLHDKIQQIHTHFLQATSITTWGFTQQESERDHKRYPLPVSVQLQTSIITYHSCLYYEVIHAQLTSPPMSLYLFSPSDYVQASTSAVFYWEDIIPVLFATEAFTVKIPGALKAIEDYQQQQLLLVCSNNVCISRHFFDTTTFRMYCMWLLVGRLTLKSLSVTIKDHDTFPSMYTHSVSNTCHIHRWIGVRKV